MAKTYTQKLRRHGREVPTVFASANSRSRSRDPWALPLPVSPVAPSLVRPVIRPVPLPLRQTDGRLFNPVPAVYRPAQRLSGRKATLAPPPVRKRATARSKALPGYGLGRLLFSAPANVQVCVSRGIRKEVLHAKRVAGTRGLKKPKYNHYSKVRC